MIVVELKGGLGNQLFQYAAGRALAEYHNTKLHYYFSSPKGLTPRSFELDYFNIGATAITSKGLLFWKFKEAVFAPLTPWVLEERGPSVDRRFFSAPSEVLLKGHWQSEKYFKGVRDLLHKEFRFQEPLRGKNKTIAGDLKDRNAVSIHIRRGDYASDKSVQQHLGTQSLDFYYRAVKKMKELVNEPVFYIFSDEPDWAKENLDLKHSYVSVVIDYNRGNQAYRDMQLMSLCSHNITANSSFSWWSAWLNKNPDKIVIAPKNWYSDGTPSEDRTPKDWIRL